MRLSGRKPSPITKRWTQRPRLVLLSLIGLNVAVFVTQLFLDAYQPGFVREYLALSDQGLRSAYGWQLITAAFLHDGPWHLLGNMFLLYLLGRDVESIIGQRQFFFLYLTGTLAGELGHLFLMPPNSGLLAASGGPAAVLVAYAAILPELELTSMIFFLLPLRLKAKHIGYAAFSLSVLGIIFDRTVTVAHSSFLGGCLAGWFYAHLLGFGRPSILQRALRQRRVEADRYRAMSPEQFIAEQIDPLLDKISREGMASLTRSERRILAKAREKIGGQS
ncbi:MAG TPA: rhomboid family intramembrane serine protease [Chthoniobacterales bacterium]|jgi:membrane associated rhomboid family serine protease|nr:rhomboid family intramembrane serine protease [Chthoniobacterales bacterium]